MIIHSTQNNPLPTPGPRNPILRQQNPKRRLPLHPIPNPPPKSSPLPSPHLPHRPPIFLLPPPKANRHCHFRGSGQTCVSQNRIYVQSNVHEAFIAELTKQVKEQMRASAVEGDQTALGCVIKSKALDKIEHLVADAKSKGAKTVTGGKRSLDSSSSSCPATILTNIFGNGSQPD